MLKFNSLLVVFVMVAIFNVGTAAGDGGGPCLNLCGPNSFWCWQFVNGFNAFLWVCTVVGFGHMVNKCLQDCGESYVQAIALHEAAKSKAQPRSQPVPAPVKKTTPTASVPIKPRSFTATV